MKKNWIAKAESAEVNMTPMLDIVFIMLIFFIVTSTFVRESGLDVTRKEDAENQANKNASSRAIYIQLCADDSLFIDRRAVDIRSVRANVEAKLAAEPGSVVIIESAEGAPTGSLVSVMDQAIEARAPVSIARQEARCAMDA